MSRPDAATLDARVRRTRLLGWAVWLGIAVSLISATSLALLLTQPWFFQNLTLVWSSLFATVVIGVTTIGLFAAQRRLRSDLVPTTVDEDGAHTPWRWGRFVGRLALWGTVGALIPSAPLLGLQNPVLVVIPVVLLLVGGAGWIGMRLYTLHRSIQLSRAGRYDEAFRRMHDSWFMGGLRDGMLGALALDMGDPETAERYLQATLKRPIPKALQAQNCLLIAQTFLDRGRHDEAADWLERGLALAPEEPSLVLRHGTGLAELGQVDAAVVDRVRWARGELRRAVTSSLYGTGTLHDAALAWVLALGGEADEARGVLDALPAADTWEDAADCWYRVGRARHALGEVDAAVDAWTAGAGHHGASALRCQRALAVLSGG